MLTYRRTSIFESTAQTLVNTVNCVGIMGKGVALEFKRREPDMFATYKDICDRRMLEPGKLWLWRGSDQWILNFPTKVHWRGPSKIEWVEAGLAKFAGAFEQQKIREISFPRLGCGNGGLDWADVRPLMEQYLAKLPIDIYVHDFEQEIGLPEHMEAIARLVREHGPVGHTFEAFRDTLRWVVAEAGDDLVEIQTEKPFQAELVADGEVRILAGGFSWMIDEEDLRGIWLSLKSGLLTKDQAGWATSDGGGHPLISLISLLPDTRPVEIERVGGSPEVALEVLPRRGVVDMPRHNEQRDLAWG